MKKKNEGVTSANPFLLAKLGGFIEDRMGLHFPPEQMNDLERGLCGAAAEFGFKSVEPCMEWLFSTPLTPDHIEILARHLTVGETYFFRDARVFEILEAHLLPVIIDSRKEGQRNLRIWSAGCSTGEEPYSLAIMLTRFFPELNDWHVTILATDISPLSMKKAREGIYGEWAFRGTPLWIREKYFTKVRREFQIDPAVRRMVTFCRLNLVEDPYPAVINNTFAMDIIFCRNVLMYFSQERAAGVIHNLSRCLVDGGWLVIGPVEAPGPDLTPLLNPVCYPGAILYRKEARPQTDSKKTVAMPTFSPATRRKISAEVKARHPAGVKQREKTPLPGEHPLNNALQRACRVRQLADRGRLFDALTLCGEAILADKLNPSLHYLRSTIQQEMGSLAEAAASLQRAIYIDQDFAIAHFALGHLLQRQGKPREAGKHFAKACSLLKSYEPEDDLPEAEGLSPARVIELISAMQNAGDRR